MARRPRPRRRATPAQRRATSREGADEHARDQAQGWGWMLRRFDLVSGPAPRRESRLTLQLRAAGIIGEDENVVRRRGRPGSPRTLVARKTGAIGEHDHVERPHDDGFKPIDPAIIEEARRTGVSLVSLLRREERRKKTEQRKQRQADREVTALTAPLPTANRKWCAECGAEDLLIRTTVCPACGASWLMAYRREDRVLEPAASSPPPGPRDSRSCEPLVSAGPVEETLDETLDILNERLGGSP